MVPFVDAHCHVSGQGQIEDERETRRCVMSNFSGDWATLKGLDGVEKCFGIHPWYSHLYSVHQCDKRSHYESVLEWRVSEEFEQLLAQLPAPIALDEYIEQDFEESQIAVVGEIGLDKLFRLPENGFYVQNSGARLSWVKVKMAHQIEVFRRMCQLACKYRKPVSLHGVKCHGVLFEQCIQELLPTKEVKVCLHSYTGSFQTLTDSWLRKFPQSRIFLSLSQYINFKTDETGLELVKAIPRSCLLTETDFPIDTQPADQLRAQLQHICEKISQACDLDGLESCKTLIYDNYLRFIA